MQTLSSSVKIKIEGDLSNVRNIDEFLREMEKVAREYYRVLKPGKVCAILIGDTRKHKHYVPIFYNVMKIFLFLGFVLKENIIKLQWNMKSTREKWRGKNYEFLLVAYEHIFVFRKSENEKELKKLKFSSKLWRDSYG